MITKLIQSYKLIIKQTFTLCNSNKKTSFKLMSLIVFMPFPNKNFKLTY